MKDIDSEMLLAAIRSTYNGASWLDPNIAQVVLNGIKEKSSKILKQTDLTEREVEVLDLIAKGYSNSKISEALFYKP
jgi:DNA-binding NarL/FixJ family response regulator